MDFRYSPEIIEIHPSNGLSISSILIRWKNVVASKKKSLIKCSFHGLPDYFKFLTKDLEMF